mmetsp:Transcript_37505/g.74428  ORF Transcript_37505/g.74428 Transcript_37505/m.74428 type:complete len:93 (-) Transcript_37505:68-346(-)
MGVLLHVSNDTVISATRASSSTIRISGGSKWPETAIHRGLSDLPSQRHRKHPAMLAHVRLSAALGDDTAVKPRSSAGSAWQHWPVADRDKAN